MTTRSFRHLPNELVANLESAPYRYASTMAGIPHYYTLRKKWEDDEAFVWTVVGIDPSFGMLAKCRLKHPDYDAHATLLRTTFEDYETTLQFDTSSPCSAPRHTSPAPMSSPRHGTCSRLAAGRS